MILRPNQDDDAATTDVKRENGKGSPVTAPSGADAQWQQKADRARQIREASQMARQDKPKSFRRSVGRAG